MLTIDEVRAAVATDDESQDGDRVRTLVVQRRTEMDIARTLTPPPFLGDPPSGPPPGDNPFQRTTIKFFGGPPQQSEHANQLKANPGSRGVASGPARIARTLDDAAHLQPGEILVAITTMPAWTPLFGVAAAVVTETGGSLSHCAIVAREYGIPAVVGAYGATQRITTGQVVTVDGSSGVVTPG
jgi:phosphohistidine swiveling domain-containing protein